MNTVNFSNHAGYGRSGGTKATAAELNAMFESMEHNELLMPTRLLTGIRLVCIPKFHLVLIVFRVYTGCRTPIGHPQTRRKTEA